MIFYGFYYVIQLPVVAICVATKHLTTLYTSNVWWLHMWPLFFEINKKTFKVNTALFFSKRHCIIQKLEYFKNDGIIIN